MEKNWTQTKKPAFDRKDAEQMNEIAQTIFAPIYPVIARQALNATGISRGLCLDIGSGPAMLAIAVAHKAPEMQVIAVDFSDDSLMIARENIKAFLLLTGRNAADGERQGKKNWWSWRKRKPLHTPQVRTRGR